MLATIVETWRPIPGYESTYEVSDHGRIRRVGAGGGAVVGRVLSTRLDKGGYPAVSLWQHGRERRFLVHRLVALAFIGPPPRGTEVNHIDFNPANPAAINLEYLTRGDNLRRMGRPKPQLPKRAVAKLTEDDVRKIRRRRRTGERARAIAKDYDVSEWAIYDISNGHRWAHVQDEISA